MHLPFVVKKNIQRIREVKTKFLAKVKPKDGPYDDFPVIIGSTIQSMVDYSFGDHSGVQAGVPYSYMKKANMSNREFVAAVESHKGKYMTLCIDNVRLYKRPIEYSDFLKMRKVTPEERKWLDNFADEDLLALCAKFPNKKFIIFTAFEDIPLDEHIRVPENVISVNAVDAGYFGGKVIPFPYGLERKMYIGYDHHKILKKFMANNRQATKLLYVNHRHNTGNRKGIYEMFSDKPWATVSERQPYKKYLSHLKNHKFILSPGGNGVESTKNWEILYMRRVPILLKNACMEFLLKDFPSIFVNDFREVTEELLIKNEHLYRVAQKMNFDKLNVLKLFIERLEQA